MLLAVHMCCQPQEPGALHLYQRQERGQLPQRPVQYGWHAAPLDLLVRLFCTAVCMYVCSILYVHCMLYEATGLRRVELIELTSVPATRRSAPSRYFSCERKDCGHTVVRPRVYILTLGATSGPRACLEEVRDDSAFLAIRILGHSIIRSYRDFRVPDRSPVKPFLGG